MAKAKLCKITDIPDGKMKVFDVKGKKVFVANYGRRFYCCDNACPHVGGPLGEGHLDKTTVTCPWHGSQFDITSGKVLAGSAQKNIQTHKITVKKDEVYADL